MGLAFVFYGIVCCVAHLYVRGNVGQPLLMLYNENEIRGFSRYSYLGICLFYRYLKNAIAIAYIQTFWVDIRMFNV